MTEEGFDIGSSDDSEPRTWQRGLWLQLLVGVVIVGAILLFIRWLNQEVATNDIKCALSLAINDSVRVVQVNGSTYAIQIKTRGLRGQEWTYAPDAYGKCIVFCSYIDANEAIVHARDRLREEREKRATWDNPKVLP